ncbi:MAG: hypothetical protein D3M94_05505 [Rhodocyclales bacterium GT-UBC]|nr:MAG: hypothetical protein D3M94_05505 [Rhodocyclales bacterium GT-UBC]
MSRYPLLVMKIKEWVATQKSSGGESARQKQRRIRNKNRSYRETNADFKLQRDKAAGLLSDANLQIVLLTEENSSLRARLDALRPQAAILTLPVTDSED